MKSTLITLFTLCGLIMLVEFLGRPLRGEPLQSGIVFHPLAEPSTDSGRVIGQVVTKGGKPVADLRVASTHPDPTRRYPEMRWNGPELVLQETRTDAHGLFELEATASEPIRLWAGAEGWLWGMTHPVEIRAGFASQGVLLTVEPRPEKP